MRRLIPILAAALVGSGLTAAAITLPARAADREDRFGERMRAWEKCMQRQGIDLEGTTTIRVEDGRVTIDGEEVDPERFRAAERTCGRPFSLPPDLEYLPDFDELPDLELMPKLPFLDPLPDVPDPDLLPRLPEFEFSPELPDVEPLPDVPDSRLDPRPEELPELQELRDRLERLENCLRGELQEA